jgi:hypothetical protein
MVPLFFSWWNGARRSVGIETVIGIGLAVSLPKWTDSWRWEKDPHASSPRLPNVVINVSSSVKEILFSAKIKVTKDLLKVWAEMTLAQVVMVHPAGQAGSRRGGLTDERRKSAKMVYEISN